MIGLPASDAGQGHCVPARRGGGTRWAALLFMLLIIPVKARADGPTDPATRPVQTQPLQPDVDQFSVHAQGTVVSQKHDIFPAQFTGPFDVPPHEPWKTSVTGTLFMGARLPWTGGEFYFDPEVSGGEGFGGVTGIAGFPNGEIPRVGTPEPQPYVARAFFRQTFGLGGEKERVDSDQNQLAGFRDISRLTVTFGKVAATDFFDNNAYSHDPRTQYLNWSLMDNAAWDYPADTRGYTYGLVLELNQPVWALRYGAFTMPKDANGSTIDWNVPKALGQAIEFEQRWTLHEQPGTARWLAYGNLAHMGNYRQAIAEAGSSVPDVTLTRTYSAKWGFGLSADQALTKDLGLFGRLGWNNGQTESFCFTEVDATASIGLSSRGTSWHRPDDVAGIAVVVNGISDAHRAYLAAGGHGFIIGDGRLPHYGTENIVESFYNCKIYQHVFVTGDFQFVDNPAYNRDRGPIFIGGVRVHVEF
ncbi:MAG TPA: carbohydrate porin [Tepidisphaeraceae bacterium]|nr:carbohydrate porin [Tepidisphaeraceae bacterium]